MPPRLPLAFAALHGADQLSLAALPLIATLALGGGPGLTGLLLAAQGAAWLVVSLPAGVLADRHDRRQLLRAGALLAALGFALAALLARHPAGLAAAAFLGAGGVVLAALAIFALVPGQVAREALPAANARLELGRAVATLAAPPLAGLLAEAGWPAATLGLAALAALLAWVAAGRLHTPALPATPRRGIGAAIAEGGRFVLGEPPLRAIMLAAIAWNGGFFALMAVVVPHALGALGLDARMVGIALGAYGAGLVAGALAAPRASRLAPIGALLIAGPALSAIGAAALVLAPGFGTLALCMALLGFGPMLWQVAQTSLRQAVAPAALLGRVGAVMQVAVFGVRPLGALGGAALATAQGEPASLLLALGGFALSLLAVLASPLPALRRLPAPA